MKIKAKKATYLDVKRLAERAKKHKKPKKTNLFFRTLLRIASAPHLRATKFRLEKIGMEKLGRKEPCLILMNHSSFIDLEIASTVFYPRPINIVATTDAYVGKEWLMRQIGCIETKKFTTDVQLVRDMSYTFKTLKASVLMYPEAGYTLDGRATLLPDNVGKCLKLFNVPVVTLTTYGAFTHQPLYNELRKRKVQVSAKMEYLLSPEDIESRSASELTEIIREKFRFDGFRWQEEANVRVNEPDRAVGLNRVLYKCPCCGKEGATKGEGYELKCLSCGKRYELTEYGKMRAIDGETEFSEIADWVDWQRACVKDEIEKGEYGFKKPVNVLALVNRRLYDIGEGTLEHGLDGFRLRGKDGELDYSQAADTIYTINSDFYFYQIADVINIGDTSIQYFCLTKTGEDYAFKTRMAAEELYKIKKSAPKD